MSVAPNTFIKGDCARAMQIYLDEASIDMALTSPPYDELRDYKGYAWDYKATFDGLHRVLKDGAVCVWVVGDGMVDGGRTLSSFKQAIYAQSIGFKMHDVMIYRKLNTPFTRPNAYTNAFEYMFVFSKEGPPSTFNALKQKTADRKDRFVGNRQKDGAIKKHWVPATQEMTRINIWEYSVGKHTASDNFASEHPATFPEKLAAEHILSWSNPGDVVLDPFVGSGTTCKMAVELGRRYIGIDISEEYIEVARKRMGLFA